MSNLSELLPAGAGAKSASFVASGTLGSGVTVALKSDGTVEAVSGTPEALSSEVAFESGSTNMTTVCYDKNTNKIFVAYVDTGNSEYGTMCVGTVSGSSISFGTPVVFFSNGTQYPAACYWEDQNKVFLAYASKATPFNFAGFSHMISISGTVPTANYSYTFANNGVYHTSVSYASSQQRVLVSWMDASNSSYGVARVAYIVTGIQIGYGSQTTFNSTTTQEIFSAYDPNTTFSAVVYKGTSSQGRGRSLLITAGSNSFSVQAEATFNAASTYNPRIAYDPDNQNFIIAYKDAGNSNKGTACIATVSGAGALSFSAEQVFADYACDWPALSYDTINNQMILSYQNNAISNRLEVRTISSDGSTLSFGDPLNVGANISYTSSAFDPDTGKTVVTYRGTNGKSVVYSPLVTNYTDFIGITDQAIADTATGAVIVQGGVSEKVTGLTANTDYYVQVNGTLSTTVSTVPAGRALSSTSILLEG